MTEAGIALSDEELIALFFDRREDAIRQTDAKYRTYLYAIAYRILSDRESTEECLNDTYLRAWNAIPPAHPKGMKAYLGKITRHLALDRYTADHRQKRVPAEQTDPLSELTASLPDLKNPEYALDRKEFGRIVSEYLSRQPDRRTYAFVARYYYALPLAPIAEKLGITPSAAGKLLKQMVREVRRELRKGGFEV